MHKGTLLAPSTPGRMAPTRCQPHGYVSGAKKLGRLLLDSIGMLCAGVHAPGTRSKMEHMCLGRVCLLPSTKRPDH